jgi:hypothetical protein
LLAILVPVLALLLLGAILFGIYRLARRAFLRRPAAISEPGVAAKPPR